MSFGKLLITLAALVGLVLGGIVLFGGNNGSKGDERAVSKTPTRNVALEDEGGEAHGDTPALLTFTPDSVPLGLLQLGENDVRILSGWLDGQGRGAFTTDTGSTGMTPGDMFPSDVKHAPGSGIAAARQIAADAAGQGDEEPVYAESDFDDVAILHLVDGDIREVRSLGQASIRALGLGLDTLIVNSGEMIALLGASGAGKTTLMRCTARLDTPSAGEVTVEGQTELGGLVDYLRGLDAAGRLEPGGSPSTVRASGIDLIISGTRGSDEPIVLVETGVTGQFLVRRPGQEPLPIREIVMTDPIARGDYVTVELTTSRRGDD